MSSTQVIIGNIVSLIACVLMVISGLFKSRKKTLIFQTADIVFAAASNIILGAFTGAIVNGISVGRNILCYKKKFNLPIKIILIVVTTGLTIIFNNKGILGFFPIISNISYTLLMDKLDRRNFKILIIFTLVWWGIYDILVCNYVAFCFDMGTIVTSLVAILKIERQKKETQC